MSDLNQPPAEAGQNPYGSGRGSAMDSGAALVTSDAQRAIEEVQAAMVIAQKFPRDARACVDRILESCDRPSLAESSQYSYARGGTKIVGASIRLAEVIAQSWGNMSFGVRELSQSREGGIGTSEVQAYAWDLERNVRREVTFSVPHVRHTRQGVSVLTDPRDVYELVANNGARRLRACILAVVPGDVVDAAVARCSRTLLANVDVTPEKVAAMAAAFENEHGVTRQQIEKRIQRNLEAIDANQVLELKRIFQSLRDGMSNVADHFEPVEGADPAPEPAESRSDGLKSRIRGASESASEAAQGAEAEPGADVPEEEPLEPPYGDVPPEEAKRAGRIAELAAMKPTELASLMSEYGIERHAGPGSKAKNVDAVVSHEMSAEYLEAEAAHMDGRETVDSGPPDDATVAAMSSNEVCRQLDAATDLDTYEEAETRALELIARSRSDATTERLQSVLETNRKRLGIPSSEGGRKIMRGEAPS